MNAWEDEVKSNFGRSGQQLASNFQSTEFHMKKTQLGLPSINLRRHKFEKVVITVKHVTLKYSLGK